MSIDRFRLHAGPYRPPRFKVGGTLDDLRGPKRVIGISEAGWPLAHYGRKTCVVLTGDLIHAIHTESVQAVARAWGISCEKVRRFWRALGVEVHLAAQTVRASAQRATLAAESINSTSLIGVRWSILRQ